MGNDQLRVGNTRALRLRPEGILVNDLNYLKCKLIETVWENYVEKKSQQLMLIMCQLMDNSLNFHTPLRILNEPFQ